MPNPLPSSTPDTVAAATQDNERGDPKKPAAAQVKHAPARPTAKKATKAQPPQDAKSSETGQQAANQAQPAWPKKDPDQLIDEWANAASGNGVPARALRAYVNAERTMREDKPNCRVEWPLLAGVGKIESNHGRFDGASLTDGGLPSKPIIGIALDGSAGVRAITDTDGGSMDGDEVWDRAVGPMQFIPSTWTKWAKDGNGDGKSDPHSIDDAAITAANYLCGQGQDLGTVEGQRSALMVYNNSTSYGNTVLHDAEHYAQDHRPPPV
ncbi:MAG: murein transglycosylase [Pseudonocardiaceae bacterium]|nr:murein transglycosylase [Pseudonocardiaceae bacterium]